MSARRLTLLAALATLVLAGCRPAPRVAEGIVSLADGLELARLADGLWLYQATIELDGRPVASNGLVVGGGEGAIVLDTPWNDALTARLLDWAEADASGVAAVVSTHFHPDRLGGIAEVHRRDIPSYGHSETVRLALEHDLPPPGSGFERELTLSTGDRTLELFYPGPGHSPDNSVVWLPEYRLLFGGCLVKSARSSGLGYVGDAVLDRWPAALEALLARYPEAKTVVPGHGPPSGLDAIRHTLELLGRHAQATRRKPEAPAAESLGLTPRRAPADRGGGA